MTEPGTTCPKCGAQTTKMPEGRLVCSDTLCDTNNPPRTRTADKSWPPKGMETKTPRPDGRK